SRPRKRRSIGYRNTESISRNTVTYAEIRGPYTQIGASVLTYLRIAMSDPSLLQAALLWSGTLRRKVAVSPSFEHWLLGAAPQAVTRKTIRVWFDELKGAGAADPLPVPEMRRALRQLR